MEKIVKIKEVVELMSFEANKAFVNGNRSASTRARKYAQELKALVNDLRKELLEASKK